MIASSYASVSACEGWSDIIQKDAKVLKSVL